MFSDSVDENKRFKNFLVKASEFHKDILNLLVRFNPINSKLPGLSLNRHYSKVADRIYDDIGGFQELEHFEIWLRSLLKEFYRNDAPSNVWSLSYEIWAILYGK